MECGCDGVIRCAGGAVQSGSEVGGAGVCTITCGSSTCDGLTQYCMHGIGGAVLPDGGANSIYMCEPIPTACTINRSCACMQSAGIAGTCVEKDGKLDVDVPLP